LAAWTQAGDFCLYHPGEQWINNQLINTNVLRWWAEYQQAAKLVFMGTSCSYAPEYPLEESYYLEGKPIDSLYTYAHTKRMLLIGADALSKQFNLQYNCFIPSTLYGPDYHQDERQLHFIFDLIRKICEAKKDPQKDVVLWGDGHQRREIVYIDDFLDSMISLLQIKNNEIVNIGAGSDYSIRDFAQIICDIVGYDHNMIKYDTTKYVGARSKILDTRKLDKILPTRSTLDIRSGLEKTIEWFVDSRLAK